MTDVAALQPIEAGAPLSVGQLKARLKTIQDVMRDVMQKDVDFGTIPGTDKPSLYKPGAEKLCVTFRLRVPDPTVEEILELDGGIRLRLRVPILAHDGSVIAVGMGEASSNELKYKWRSAVCHEEWDETPEDRRRQQWKRGREKPYQVEQVRTEAADLVNTILKMAHKRAYVHGVIMATGASSIFTQDIEDLPEEMRNGEAAEDASDQRRAPITPPQRKSTGVAESKPTPAAGAREPGEDDIPFEGPADTRSHGPTISDQQGKRLYGIAMGAGFSKDSYRQWLKSAFGVGSDRDIPASQYDAVVEAARRGPGR